MNKNRERPDRVLVIYKSGAQVELRCKSFSVRKRGAQIEEVMWEDPSPRPLHLGVDEIAAVWELLDA